ncbi:ligand-binding sensor domain-containing protein [Hymenobacter daecheongensis DSM 21074]|uniref:Ligand-binding sensor domain-containing protein n=2 Tax=Hymenobacter daecheongensis TaxID=496053 RepID=A0A1M6H497_9BACT|nr:ligand-binding sensor domain-containing protein [Hymenobacter daecheongensis DSM 21074]
MLGLLCGLLGRPGAVAQPAPTLTFRTLSSAHGLSENSVHCMAQDRRGFLWLGTQDGLSRYDGTQFRVFRHDPQQLGSLSSNYVLALALDQQGRLWVGTGGGLGCYNPLTERFRTFLHHPDSSGSLADNFVRAVFGDRQGRLWVGTEGGLQRFDPQTGRFQLFRPRPAPPQDAHLNSIRAIAQDRQGRLWVGTGAGQLSQVNPAAGTLEPAARWVAGSAITALCADTRGGLLWVGTEAHGLALLPADGGAPRFFRPQPQVPASLPGNMVRAIWQDARGRLWVGTNNGLARYEPVTASFYTSRHQPGVPQSLADDVVLSLFQDRSGLLWAGTEGGLSTFEGRPGAFRPVPGAGPAAGPVWAVSEDRQGRVWVGTETAGLVCYDPATNRSTRFRHDPQDPGSLSEDFVRALCFDARGRLWIGTQSQGLDCLEPGASRFRHYRHAAGQPSSLADDFIRSISSDRQGHLWIGTEGGLTRLEPDAGRFTTFRQRPNDPRSLSNNFVRAVLQDRRGQLWVGTGGGGLCRFNPVTGRFTTFRADARVPGGLSSNFVRCLLEDHAGRLWVGTEGGGLCRLDDAAAGRFTTFRETQGLPNDVVYGIVEDEQHTLWLSTNEGLARFRPATGQFHTFDVRDGLPHNEFNAGAYGRGHDGQLYFGGQMGLVRFWPAAVRTNAVPPVVVLTGFRKFNQPVALDTSITERRSVVLGPKDYFFSLQFAALDFRLPDKNRYAYRLENFDPDWVQAGARHEATYTNLDPGTYTFRVRAANNDGVWNPRGAALVVVVQPPWYGTWWFRILASWTVFGVLFLLYQLRIRQVLALEQVRHNIARDLHDDMGSTLSSISILSQIARNHQRQHRPEQAAAVLEQIGESSHRMLDAMDDIVWTINPAHDSLADVMARMRGFASDVLEVRGIDLHFRTDPSVAGLKLTMRARREFFLLFKEAVNNLAKYAQCQQATIALTYEQRRLVLLVQDDGIGFDPAGPAQGGGNGLTNMHARAAALHGQLTICTAPGQGTTLRLSIPLKS